MEKNCTSEVTHMCSGKKLEESKKLSLLENRRCFFQSCKSPVINKYQKTPLLHFLLVCPAGKFHKILIKCG